MAGLLNMAAQGRNGDTRIAHVTPGEVVIPKEIAAIRPDLVAHIGGIVKKMGGDPTSLVVGRGRVNPQTGIEEFATAEEVRAAYQSVLGRAPDEVGLQHWMAQDNLGTFRAAAAPELAVTGYQGAATPTRSTVNDIYQSTFGRPAEDAGVNYWLEQANLSPGINLNTAISGGAQGADTVARNDIAAGGVDTSTTWGGGASLDTPNLVYDAANNTWGAAPVTPPVVTVPTETPQYTASTVTPSTYGATNQSPAATWTPATSDPTVTYNAANADVSTVTQDPRYGTVEGRIGGLLGSDSQLMQRAAQRGMDLANTRGLLNSGMAAQSAQTAVMDQALPIASADAASFNTIQANNMAAQNRNFEFNAAQQQLADAANSLAQNARAEANAGRTQEADRLYAAARDAVSQFNANAVNQASQYNATAQNQANQFNAAAQNAAAAQAVENANQFALQTLRGDQAQALAATEAQYKTTIQSNASAANFYASVVQQWTASQTTTGTTAEQKQDAATYFQQALQNGMAIISAGAGDGALDYASLLDFTTTAGAPA